MKVNSLCQIVPSKLAPCLLIVVLHLSADTKSAVAATLKSNLNPGDEASVEVTLEMGGHLFVRDSEGRTIKIPMSAAGKLAYRQHLLAWSSSPSEPARDLRRYTTAEATIKSDAAGAQRQLPSGKELVVAELADGRLVANGLNAPLTREQADLIDTMGDLLAIDRLLPQGESPEGKPWKHDSGAIAALLGMDHLAACDVQSQVTGESHGQVQLTLKGTANGSIDGAATEIELEGAYLFHPERGRITKFNLAVRENRKPGDASPGLETTAKLSLRVLADSGDATETTPFAIEEIERAAALATPELRHLLIDAPKRGLRFHHDASWIVTGDQHEMLSMRLLQQGRMIAHCNVASLPPGAVSHWPTLSDFAKDVQQSLGGKVEEVAAATEWKTSTGHLAFGIFANGKIEETPIQWRYYLISGDGLAPATVSVTLEQGMIPEFADADRLIVDSLELLAQQKSVASPAPPPASKAAQERAPKRVQKTAEKPTSKNRLRSRR